MFTKPMDQLNYADIDEFCQDFPEGERVEYTEVMPTGGKKTKNIPTLVSAFANTSGGILIIGVKTDENNKAILPIEGIPSQRGIEEQIAQSSSMGIYPSVNPEVRIVPDVPNCPDNVVVVVRVSKSQLAPHATDSFTKVYIRVGSTTLLATIDKIEHMWKRRETSSETNEESGEVRNRIFRQIQERIDSKWSTLSPIFTVSACPAVLDIPLIPTFELYEFMRTQANNPFILFNDAPLDFGTWQVPEGVCFVGATVNLLYREINEYGIVYHAEELHRSKYETFHGPEDDEENRYLELNDIVKNIYQSIAVAKDFYKRCQYSGIIEITAHLRNVLGERVMFGREPHYSPILRRQSLQPEITARVECCARDLLEFDKSSGFIVDLVGKLLWGFNAIHDTWEDIVRERIDRWQNQYGAL